MLTWINYFNDMAGNPDHPLYEIDGKDFNHFDLTTRSFVNDPEILKNYIQGSRGLNFLLTPMKGKSVRVVHSCFTMGKNEKELVVVGLAGTRRTAPFKLIPTKQITKGMKAAVSTRDKQGNLPSFASFNSVESVDDFKSLEGAPEGLKASVLHDRPNSFLIHPAFFTDLIKDDITNAAELGVAVIRRCKKGYNSKDSPVDGEITKALEDSLDLLLFLWAVEKGLTYNVTLEDIPGSELLDIACTVVSEKLERWMKDNKDAKSPGAKRDSSEEDDSNNDDDDDDVDDGDDDDGDDRANVKIEVDPKGRPYDSDSGDHYSIPSDEDKKPAAKIKREKAPPKTGKKRKQKSDSATIDSPTKPARRELKFKKKTRVSRDGFEIDLEEGYYLSNSGSGRAKVKREDKMRKKSRLDDDHSGRLRGGGKQKPRSSRDERRGRSPSYSNDDDSRSYRKGSKKSRESKPRRKKSRKEEPSDDSSSSDSYSDSDSSESATDSDSSRSRRRRRSRSPPVVRKRRSPSDSSSGSGRSPRSRGDRKRNRRSPDQGRRRTGRSRPSRRDPNRRPKKGHKKVSRHGRRRGTRAEDDRKETRKFHSVMTHCISQLTNAQMDEKKRADTKKSMLSRMAPEQSALVTLLSAKSWRDEKPKINSFTTKLMEDKDLGKALDIIASQVRRWSGQVSPKQLTSFLARGFAAHDIHKSPGGFTAFMFRPKSARYARSPEEERNAIRSMFGDSKLDDESLKYYAKNEFYLAGDFTELEEQLRTTIEFLDLITRRKGISSEGYEYGLQLLLEHRPLFLELIDKRPIFCAEYIYMLDTVFQNFVYKLGSNYLKSNPIKRAKRDLQYYQVDSITSAMRGFEVGVTPLLRLPASLSTLPVGNKGVSSGGSRGGRPTPEVKRDEKKDKAVKPDNKDPAPAWWSKNENPQASWILPEGKSYKDFFDNTTESGKGNLKGWPRIQHHRINSKKSLCIRYQTSGKCRAQCLMAHCDGAKLDVETFDLVTVRFKAIYHS
jgi:hypothetical protein